MYICTLLAATTRCVHVVSNYGAMCCQFYLFFNKMSRCFIVDRTESTVDVLLLGEKSHNTAFKKF